MTPTLSADRTTPTTGDEINLICTTTITVPGASYTYEFKKADGTSVASSPFNSYRIASAAASHEGAYTCVVKLEGRIESLTSNSYVIQCES